MTALKKKRLLDPFFQTRHRYWIIEGSTFYGEVFVLDPQHIMQSVQIRGLRCMRK
jgi:hypothetical protein